MRFILRSNIYTRKAEFKLQQSFPCPKCGAQIAVGQYFCGGCGQRFEYRCRHCGTAVSNSSGFCENCGGKLSHVPRQSHPAAKNIDQTYYRQEARVERTAAGHVGRYLIVVAVIFVMVGIIYAIGSSSQAGSSNWLGGYSFGGQSPPTTPPPSAVNVTDDQEKPEATTSDLPGYTTSEVIAAAKQFNPDCRLQTRRTG